ncbi:DUF6493 family protein [Crossiella cryophila]|uniref:DUF6493 domain-containing protein n=1 Tax=Crossiella cryophila TaxID=43355 RepID=A0A7W7CDF5_9PSEU|nr:DUF6493 family protein [Crossiella cryophila]MBB4679137.1 hypothetical protein [Crossiella cryophila]
MLLREVLAGGPEDVLTRVLGLSRERRRELVPELTAVLREGREVVEGPPGSFGARDAEGAERASVALMASVSARDPLWRELRVGDPGILRRVLLAREPAERAVLAERAVRGPVGWGVVRELVRAGELEPVRTAEYFAGWFGWHWGEPELPLAERLRKEPGALEELWELLPVEGAGDSSFAAYDKYVAESEKWGPALVELSRSGEVDRARLLELTVEVLGRDFSAYRAQWYTALHEGLAPSAEERAGLQHRYARLCGSGLPRTVSFAVKALGAVDKAGLLDDEVALRHLPAAAAGRGAGTAKLAVRLAGVVVKRRPELAAVAAEVFRAGLGHEASDVRELAAARLDVPLAAPAPVVVSDAAYPEPVVVPWAQRRMLVRPLGVPDSPAALAEGLSALLADEHQADLFLAVLGGASRVDGDVAGAVAPLVKRARKVLGGRQPSLLQQLVGSLVLGLAGQEVVPPELGSGWQLPLRHRVAALLAGTAVPVSAATHEGGWLDPVVFVTRMIEHPAVAEVDVVDALLRLAPEGRREALALAAGLSGPYAEVVRYALGGDGVVAEDWVGLAATRARYPEAADPLAALRGEPRPEVVWSARVGQDSFGLTKLFFEESPEPVTPKGLWLGWATEWPWDGVWDGYTLPHEVLSSPYDRDWVDATVAQHLFYFDIEVADPTEIAGLTPYLDRPSAPGFAGVMMIAAALNTRREEGAQLGVDVAVALFEQRLLGPRALGRALGVLGAELTPTRLVKRLSVVAGEHPAAVLSTVDALLPALDPGLRGVFALLELAAEQLERGAGAISAETRQWLGGFSGSSKAAKAASRLAR